MSIALESRPLAGFRENQFRRVFTGHPGRSRNVELVPDPAVRGAAWTPLRDRPVATKRPRATGQGWRPGGRRRAQAALAG